MGEEDRQLQEACLKIEKEYSECRYPELPAQFENFLENPDGMSFYEDDFHEAAEGLRRQCVVDYDFPIRGRFLRIKRFIKKLYRFHMKQLWDTQNGINREMAELFCRAGDYICRQKELEEKCKDYEKRIQQLEEMVKQK